MIGKFSVCCSPVCETPVFSFPQPSFSSLSSVHMSLVSGKTVFYSRKDTLIYLSVTVLYKNVKHISSEAVCNRERPQYVGYCGLPFHHSHFVPKFLYLLPVCGILNIVATDSYCIAQDGRINN